MVRAGAARVAAVLDGQGLDLLINNAGVANIATGVLEAVDMTEARRLFDINVFGMVNVIQAHLPLMHQSRRSPRIINFASGAVRVPLPCSAIYNMSKYAVEGMTNTLRYELAPFGIQATSIEPGAVATGMTANPVEGTARTGSARRRKSGVAMNRRSAPSPTTSAGGCSIRTTRTSSRMKYWHWSTSRR